MYKVNVNKGLFESALFLLPSHLLTLPSNVKLTTTYSVPKIQEISGPMSTKVPHFCENSAEKNKVKHRPPENNGIILRHPVDYSSVLYCLLRMYNYKN